MILPDLLSDKSTPIMRGLHAQYANCKYIRSKLLFSYSTVLWPTLLITPTNKSATFFSKNYQQVLYKKKDKKKFRAGKNLEMLKYKSVI